MPNSSHLRLIETPPALPRTQRSVVWSGDVKLVIKRWGNPGAPVLVLVHGYPDNSQVWDRVVPWLATEFQVVTYDVRGAGDSDKPGHKSAYALPLLMADFKTVIDAVSPDAPVHVVAHDWGSVQSWESVTEPSLKGRIASFTSCSGPCLDHMGHWMRNRWTMGGWSGKKDVLRQGLKSWYIYFFHIPGLPRWLWHMGLPKWWPLFVRWSEGTVVEAHEQQASDGSFGVLLYRANIFPRLLRPRERHAHAPVQVIIPSQDWFVGANLADGLERWVPNLTKVVFRSGHWLPLSHPKDMADCVRRFVHKTSEDTRRQAS